MDSSDWIPVTQKFPESGKKVIAYYENELGKPRRIMAYYAAKYDVESDMGDQTDVYEYCEEKDLYFLVPGWYENNEFDEVNYAVTAEITHWMSLPPPPKKRT
jgi:hypothetical protein